MAQRTSPCFVLAALVLGVAIGANFAGVTSAARDLSTSAGGAAYGSSSSESVGEWTSFPAKSCMDDGGANMQTLRGMSASDCRRVCEEYDHGSTPCAAVTLGDDGSCYLKASCLSMQERDNGDNSWLLLRGGSDGYDWKSHGDRSCMDETLDTIRHVSANQCRAACESNPRCGAITLSEGGSCYTKATCDDMEQRNNGDKSWTLSRGGCLPPTTVYCTAGSTSSKCVQYCGAPTAYAQQPPPPQCGGTIYVCL